MCGRYAVSRGAEDLAGLYEVEKWDPAESFVPDWNVAPTKSVPVILERPVKDAADPRPVRQLRMLRWGLVPSWAKSPEGAARMINARAETVHEKPSFRKAFAARRCIVPADGYYEWVTSADERELEERGKRKRVRKQPYFVTPADGGAMAMAGIYEFWRDRTLPDEHPSPSSRLRSDRGDPTAWWATCSVVTTEAETTELAGGPAGEGGPSSLAEIHPRMPLMLTPDKWGAWLDPSLTEVEEVRGLLVAPGAGLMRAYPVGTAVSNVRNNGPELMGELAGPEVGTLF